MAEHISKMLGVPKKDVIEMEQRLGGDSSLNTTLSSDTATDHQDMLVDPSASIEEDLGNREDMAVKKRLLLQALETLSDREKTIVCQRFLTDEPVTLEELGNRFKISRERIRQIENKAFEKISKYVKSEATYLTI